MMTQMQMLHIFWDMWGNHDLSFYRVYVECGAITKEQYKEITNVDYQNYSGGWEEYKKEVTICAYITRIFMGGDSVDTGGDFRHFQWNLLVDQTWC